MAKKQPLYPHVPKSRMAKPQLAPRLPQTEPPGQEVRLRFLPDSPEFLAETITCTGCREKLERVFLDAIARAKGGK